MDKQTFDQLGIRPGLRVNWGGKPCRLKSVDHKTGTCFVAPLNRTCSYPYAVSYSSVEIADVQHPRRSKEEISRDHKS